MSDDPTGAALAAAQRYIEVGQPQRALEILGGGGGGGAGAAPTGPRALELRGYAYYGIEDFDRAAATARDGLADAPDSLPLLYLLSLAEEQRGDLGAAEAAILAALELDPDDPQLLCQYADLVMRAGQLEKAGRLLDVTAASDPHSPDVLKGRLSLAYLRDDQDEVRRLSQELLEMNPESAQGHRMLGAIEFRSGSTARAAERFAEAVRLSPEHHGTAESARAARELARPVYFPVRFFDRYGVARTWIAWILISMSLRAAGLTAIAGVLTLVWLTLVIWSWVAGFVLSRRLR